MERLSCLAPEMALKEIWVVLLAYHLIRLMMAQAALFTHQQPRQLSVHSRSRVRLNGSSLTRIWTGLHHPALKGEDCAERVALFKHSVQIWLAWVPYVNYKHTHIHGELFVLIAQQKVGHRPGRIEPRAVKRRPKCYPILTKPRAEAREIVMKNGHPKKLK